MDFNSFSIEQITRENYHMFSDMVYWRMTGVELTKDEKEANISREIYVIPRDLEHPGFYAYGALLDGRFVGWITIMYTPKIARLNPGVIYIDELWVAPEFRRKGIAQHLINKAYYCQKETGAVEVRLYTADDNIPAQELYKKCGLKADGKAVYMKTEKLEDAI